MFTLSANSYRFYLHLEGFSAIYTTYCKQWQLSAPQYCSTLIKQFAVIAVTAFNLIFIQIITWMSPYWDNKSLPNPTRYLKFNF